MINHGRSIFWLVGAAAVVGAWGCGAGEGGLRLHTAEGPDCTCAAGYDLQDAPLMLEADDKADRYVEALGEQAGIWGTARTGLEVWAYPFKLMDGLTVDFSTDGGKRFRPAGDLLTRQVATPYAARMEYGEEAAKIRATLFAPRKMPAAMLLLDADAADTEVLLRFKVSLAPMQMKAAGEPYVMWSEEGHRLTAVEPARGAALAVWSPAAVGHERRDGREEIRLHISAQAARDGCVPVVIAGGLPDGLPTEGAISSAMANLGGLFNEAAQHYRRLLQDAPAVDTPDPRVNEAMAWSVVSLDQLRVKNPTLGYGLVSGYSPSRGGTQPRYAWFFDEPTLTSWAYLCAGLHGHVGEALELLLRYQRGDGKMVHEITQSLVYWPDYFDTYKYAYIHASSGTYFLAACGNYYRRTGDLEFVRRHWDNLCRMLDWCFASADTEDGLLRIGDREWGSSESSFEVGKDTQMEGMWLCALRQMAYLAEAMGDSRVKERCVAAAGRAEEAIEATFWDEDEGTYLWGVDRAGRRLRSIVPHHSVSVWMDSLRADRVKMMLQRMAQSDCRTDWGVRSLAASDARYDAQGYQTGSVWPVWNAGVIIGDYRHGRTHDGFRNFMAMVQLRTVGALGPMPEVLSGRQCQLLEGAVPHQMFSETAVQNAFYEGLLGLDVDVPGRTVGLSPYLPAAWNTLSVRNIPVGEGRLDLEIGRTRNGMELAFDVRSPVAFDVHLRPALPAGCSVSGVFLDGAAVGYDKYETAAHTNVATTIPRCTGRHTLAVGFLGGFDFVVLDRPLQRGESSRNLRLIEAKFQAGTWRLAVEGLPGTVYPVSFHTGLTPAAMVNARILDTSKDSIKAGLVSPADAPAAFDGYVKWQSQITWPAQPE